MLDVVEATVVVLLGSFLLSWISDVVSSLVLFGGCFGGECFSVVIVGWEGGALGGDFDG
jgi:hypothetical protein